MVNKDVNPLKLFGRSYPLGANIYDGGVNFSIYSKNAEAIELLLFDEVDDHRPSRIIRLNPKQNRTFHYWHIFVTGIGEGQLYAYRVFGPFEPDRGLRFDGSKVLLDPYVRAIVVGKNYDRQAAIKKGDNCLYAMKGVVVDPRSYNWENDIPLETNYATSIIYELHVAGFTKNPNSGIPAEKRGTYAALAEKIPYLQSLGVTAVELLPVQQFDEQDVHPPLKNYWGYNPVGFFAPHCGYSSDKSPLGPLNEFRDMVKAFHKAGIEVILDVVFNHTAEGDHRGPTLSFRGLENTAYYILNNDRAHYANYSGTGNTLNANNPVVRRMILDCLRYWAMQMHVDGFRFDLASVLSRGEQGEPLENPPLLWAIESSPELAGTKIIAEAWDAAGLYQVGSFIGDRWAEWNGRFRDDIRRFIKGDEGMAKNIASRIIGSHDIYLDPDREPNRSINFITCHDGFTLNDLVSYNHKHNESNGENNQDGTSENFSWNCGEEGPSNNADIEALRLRQIKNFLTLLFISQGTPMLLMGDEVRRTQSGNNNAYCQDNQISWFDWDLINKNKELLAFVKGIINFTQSRPVFAQEQFLKTESSSREPYILWHGVQLDKPDWNWSSHSLACTLVDPDGKESLHIMINAYWKELEFEIPLIKSGNKWRLIVDTAREYPEDFNYIHEAPLITNDHYLLHPRSVVILYKD
jgi:isoamylase